MQTGRSGSQMPFNGLTQGVEVAFHLSNGQILRMTRLPTGKKGPDPDQLFYYTYNGTSFLIKSKNVKQELVGATALLALGVPIPPFYLVLLNGQPVFLQEILVHPKTFNPVDYDIEMLSKMTAMTAAVLAAGDDLGMPIASKHALIDIEKKIAYRVNYSNVFAYQCSFENFKNRMLEPEKYMETKIAAMAHFLRTAGMRRYLNSLSAFIQSIDPVVFFGKVSGAYYHDFFYGMKETPKYWGNIIACYQNLQIIVKKFPGILKDEIEKLNQQVQVPLPKAVQDPKPEACHPEENKLEQTLQTTIKVLQTTLRENSQLTSKAKYHLLTALQQMQLALPEVQPQPPSDLQHEVKYFDGRCTRHPIWKKPVPEATASINAQKKTEEVTDKPLP